MEALTGTTSLSQSGPGNNNNERVLHISRSSRTGTTPSDILVSYLGHSLGGGVLLLCRNAVGVCYIPMRLGYALFCVEL